MRGHLIVALSSAALAKCPYRYGDVVCLERKTVVVLKLTIPWTDLPYTMSTHVYSLVAGFVERCADAGVHILEKHGAQAWTPAAPHLELPRPQGLHT